MAAAFSACYACRKQALSSSSSVPSPYFHMQAPTLGRQTEQDPTWPLRLLGRVAIPSRQLRPVFPPEVICTCCRRSPAAAVWSPFKYRRLCSATRQSRPRACFQHGPLRRPPRHLCTAGGPQSPGGAAPKTLQGIQRGEAGELRC